jgi:tape measure domain-containing protein
MEQAQIAMEFFTESAEKGQKFLERLQAFAAKTPFEFPDVRQAAIGLMPLYKNMYGVDKAMDETIRTIRAFGDAAGFTGAGINGMNLALLGFKQIGTMGKLQMEELRQVTENLLIPMDIVLKELGLTGDALADLGKRGIPAKTAMEAIIRALEKNFAGGMEKLSQSLLGLVSTVKDTAKLTVTAFGAGMAGPVRRILLDLVGITDYTGEKYKAFQAKLQDAGRRVGEYFERVYNRVKRFWGELAADPAFQKLDFGDKLIYVLDKALDAVKEWLEGPGGKKIQAIFVKLGEIAATAWIAGIIGMVKGAFSSALHGNILGGIGLLLGAGMLGGGLLLRGVLGIGKGIFGAGKWLFGKLRPATTAAATAEEAATGAKTAGLLSRLPKLSGVSKVLGRLAWPLAILGGVAEIATAKDKIAASGRVAGALGGAALGAKAGAAIGTAVMPGAGTAVGGVIGGLVGGIAGALSVEALVQRFNILKQKASEAWDTIKQKANEAWTWITTNINLESLVEKMGYIWGYLEGTIFNAEWWLTKWESVKAWTASAWAGMVNTWNSVRETIGNTIFNAEWWLAKWEGVKAWTSGAWASAVTIWESVKATISNTLFNAKWWLAKWEAVKNWASGALKDIGVKIEGVRAKWEGIKSSFEAGREAGRQATRSSVTAHAAGGILTRPHLGLVAEAGPEAIIPLSARMRSRALALYEETGRRLGVRPYAEGGLVGPVPALAVGGVSQAMPTATINMHFDLAGLVGQIVVNNQSDIDSAIDRIAGAIADNLRGIFQNMTKK